MSERNYWVYCDDHCKFPAMTKEQTLDAIAQAVSTGEIKDVDAGFITKLKTINGTMLKFFVGTQAEYEALPSEDKNNLFSIITNDTTKAGIETAIETLQNELTELSNALASGSFIAKRAGNLATRTISPDTEITKCGLYAITLRSGDSVLSVMAPLNESALALGSSYGNGLILFSKGTQKFVLISSAANYSIDEIRLITEY